MRVAVIVRSLKIGGMERVAVSLAEAFADAGDESHLIYFRDKGRVFTPRKSVYLHHFNLDKLLNFTIIGALLSAFAKILNGIFRNTFFIYKGILLAPIFRYKLTQLEKQYGTFDLIILRGHGTFELIWPVKDDRIVQMIESIFIRHGSRLDNYYVQCVYSGKNLASVSSGVKQKVLEVLNTTSVKAKSLNIVHNPINIEQLRKKANAYKPEIVGAYIISVGRITPNKNIPFLLESYKYAREYLGFDLPLVIIGDGHDMKRVKAKVTELNLQKYVKLLGLLENPYPWIKGAVFLTSTSKAEGFGMVLVEALVLHTKVISTQSKGGVKDIMIEELQNYMVDFSVEKFAKKIVKVSEEKEVVDYDKFTNSFTSEAIVKKYKQLYLS